MFAGLSDIVAEAFHHFQTDHVAGLLGLILLFSPGFDLLIGDLLDLGIEVFAVFGEFKQPRHVVDTGDMRVDVCETLRSGIELESFQQGFHADLNGVAETDSFDSGGLEHSSGEHSHRVGVVEEPGIGSDFFDVSGKIQHHRNGAQGSEDTADAEGVGDGLTQTVFLGDLEVDDSGGFISADLDRVDDKISSGEYEGLCCSKEHYNIPDPEFLNFFDKPEAYKPPKGAESIEELRERTADFLQEIVHNKSMENDTILVSTHGAALRGMISGISHIGIEDFWRGGVHKNCAVTIVDVKDGQARILEEGKTFY